LKKSSHLLSEKRALFKKSIYLLSKIGALLKETFVIKLHELGKPLS
jgi:hypothetical protein